MASKHSYEITVSNNITEKEAINYLLSKDERFINPTKESRKIIMELLNIETKYSRAFDLIIVEGHTNKEENIILDNTKTITLIELKTTKKRLPNLPKGFFFGATEREFQLAEILGEGYQFCFISLHQDSIGFKLMSLDELNGKIKTKRVQFQINL